jgi:predicted nucleic acid-binding protein
MIARREARPLVTTNLVIAELHRAFLHTHGRRAARLATRSVLAAPRLALHFESHANHARALERLHYLMAHRITYTDAVSFAVMEERGLSLALGFDDDFRLAGFQLAGDVLG